MNSKRVAIVTGSASGIGAATALELGERGWRVVVNYSKSKEQAEQIAARCAEAIVVQANVAEDADCRRLVQAALDKWGQLDALVNNAGTTKFVPHGELDGLSAEDFQRIYATNVIAPFQMCRAAAPALKRAHGAIVNVSSVAALLGTGSSIAYAASKAALDTLSTSLARVLAPEVRVNVVAPGFVDTPWMTAGYGVERYAKLREAYAASAPLGDVCKPEDIAGTIAWLIEGASKVTGQIVYVDSGIHVATPRRG
jgi:NAD(P)-dependent dehydrogenase (short-subunit alcohol dehydrogenase family)